MNNMEEMTYEEFEEMKTLYKETIKGWLVDMFTSPFLETPYEFWQSSLTLLMMFIYLGFDTQPEPWLVFTLMITGVIFFTKGIINEYIKNDS